MSCLATILSPFKLNMGHFPVSLACNEMSLDSGERRPIEDIAMSWPV